MSDHDFINAQIRRQIVEATYNAPHFQPVVNLCGALNGQRVEVFGETLLVTDFKSASEAYHTARLSAAKALVMLNRTLSEKAS